MIAYLSKAGTLPVLSDVFRIAVMIGSSSGMHCFSNQVGMGSSAQEELDADSIVFCISSEVANLRQSSFPSVNGAMSRPELESNVKFTLNLEFFSTRKLLNNSARTESSSDEGMVAQFWFTNSVFAMLNKALCDSVRDSPALVIDNFI